MLGTITIQLNESDFLSAHALHIRSIKFWVVWGGLLLAALSLYVIDPLLPRHVGVSIGWIGAIVVGLGISLLMRRVVVPLQLRCLYRQEKSLRLPSVWSWDEAGFSIENEKGCIKNQWSDLKKWKEDKDVFLLYTSDIYFYAVLTRAFTDDKAMSLFRRYLA